MALLTEEQINEILQKIYVYGRNINASILAEWNEKQQPSAQFEPDWSKAPKYTVGATLNIGWETENGNWAFGYQVEKYSRPAPVITPHPHAALMTKYAEVAQRRRDPWVEFQVYSDPFSYWVTLEAPTFFDSVQRYRHIGDDK